MEELVFKLDNFEGPLDLLLTLVAKNKMDLHNIPIIDLIDQYTAVIRNVQEHRLDVAVEFLEMAARLVEMKSYLLLPRSEEEAESMRSELTGQLIEYDLCKKMAALLRARGENRWSAVRAPMELPPNLEYTRHNEVSELKDAWDVMQGRKREKRDPDTERFEPIVTAPFVSVASRVVHLLRGLVTGRLNSMRQLFAKTDSRSTTVATFLALLEMVRSGRVAIDDEQKITMSRRKIKPQANSEDAGWT